MARAPGRAVAVVIGAGIAGLAAVRTLADHFDRVVLVDRDRLPDRAAPRRGVPQGHHPHIVLMAGLHALSDLFPGLHEDLVRAGATYFDLGEDLCFHRYGTVWPRISTGLGTLSLSRPLLETTLRRRIVALPNVTLRSDVAVTGLAGTGGTVTGVVLDDGEVVAADLVVDCSGRGSRSDRWLPALGFPAPDVLEVKVGISYSTRLYRRKSGDLAEGAAVFVLPTPPDETRVGVALPIEDDRWMVAIGGWHIEHPPVDPDAFVSHARELPYGVIADLVTSAEPVSEVAVHRFPSSRRRRFERLRDVPAGYLSTGDAICSFNPVYGQGMTCAILQAVALGSTLDRYGAPSAAMARAFYRAAARIITTPWRFAVGADFVYPQTRGRKPPGIDLLNWYSRQLQLAARDAVDIRRVFTSVQHLVTPPAVLFTPAMVARVLRAAVARRGGAR